MIETVDIDIRQHRKEDEACIYSSWLKSYRKSVSLDGVHNDVYFPEHTKIIADILDRSFSYMIVDPSDENHIFGYAVVEHLGKNDVIHFVYIKQPYRRMGLLKLLIEKVIEGFGKRTIFISHLPKNYHYL